jgi:hypothetical protein
MNVPHTLRPVLVLALLAPLACGYDDPADEGDARAPSAIADGFAPTDAEREEILGALQKVFDALAAGDGDLLRSVMDADVRMVSTETDERGVISVGTSSLEGLVQRIESSSDPLVERMWQPEVRTRGAISSIWTPYDFYVGDTLSHCGIDVATLVRSEEGWKIVALNWSRAQPPACDLHPDGPPGG